MEKKMIVVLQALDMAKGSCPLGFISLHTNIAEPLPILEALEKAGLARRVESREWSLAGGPRFEITDKARKQLREMESASPKVSLSVVEEALTHH
ncbi:MAG: hypothetical protein C4K49_00960 [Candidatus Thorarchaeota archaeon]|nr:MAG: hypothetical protein C4K49_00960 [Candidatus Thorarchaeota archaeon]